MFWWRDRARIASSLVIKKLLNNLDNRVDQLITRRDAMKNSAVIVMISILSFAIMAFAASKIKTTPSGLSYEDTKVGTGTTAVTGKTVVVDYTGWLNKGGKKGKEFDSSIGKNKFSFPLGASMVIKGWDEGVAGMKVGGKRTLYIPAKLGYGARGAGDKIPPNSDLIFDVELFEVK